MKQASICIIENKQKEILLLRRNFEPFGWCLPGGKFDTIKESALECVKREVLEETGFDLTTDHIVFVKQDISINKIPVYIFKARVNSSKCKLSKEHSNFIWVDKILPELPLAGNTLSFLSDYTFDSSNLGFDDKIYFGKYKNFSIKQILFTDPQYIIWMNNKTDNKVTINVLNKANKIIEQNYQNIRDEENKIAREKSDREYYAERLRSAVDTPYGKAINNHNGNHTLIDESGRSIGICHWYWGWEQGSWEDTI